MQSRRSFKEQASRDETRRTLARQQAQLAQALRDGETAPDGFPTDAFNAAVESLRIKKARESAGCKGAECPTGTVQELRQVFLKPQRSMLASAKDIFSALFFRRPSH